MKMCDHCEVTLTRPEHIHPVVDQFFARFMQGSHGQSYLETDALAAYPGRDDLLHTARARWHRL
jgi:hypothetical protein